MAINGNADLVDSVGGDGRVSAGVGFSWNSATKEPSVNEANSKKAEHLVPIGCRISILRPLGILRQ